MNRDIYEVILDTDNPEGGVNAISLVNEPAMERFAEWIMLSKEQPYKLELAEVDTERRIFLAAVLIPNKPIMRIDGGEMYDIIFSKETIQQTAHLYLKRGNQKKVTYEHDLSVDGVTVVETWIKEDAVHDKSVKFGLNAPLGSWIVMMKADNETVWNDAKEGKIKGFSIEGYFIPKLKTQLSKSKDRELLDTVIDILKNG